MKYIAVAVLLAALGYGAVRVNRRLTPARPSPRTLAERYGWEMEMGDDREAVVALVVAVDRYIDNHNEADEGVRRQLWQAMTSAKDAVAEALKAYPL